MELNVISLDVPYPPDYGGAIDIYYKLKALHKLGINIHLHCFEGRQGDKELLNICSTAHYYKSKTSKLQLLNSLPYNVLSRQSDYLKENLHKNDFPILMEGLHSTFLLRDRSFAGRRIIVRAHNIEHDYFKNLAKVENNIFRKLFYYSESFKLKKYEETLEKASVIAAISPNDFNYFSKRHTNVHYIPAFHGHERVTATEGKGSFAFYHGNLSLGENNNAALYLVKKVFNDIPHSLIIAGRQPSKELINAIKGQPNVTLKENPSSEAIQEYIHNAHCNILPTFQSTGIKLKLLFALFAGRFCIVNGPMIENTGLENLCITADTANAMKEKIVETFSKYLTPDEITIRGNFLMQNFSDEKNANKLLRLISNHL